MNIEEVEHELDRCGSTDDPVVWKRDGEEIDTTASSVCMAHGPFDDAKEIRIKYSSMTRDRWVHGTLSGLVSDRLKGLRKRRCCCD